MPVYALNIKHSVLSMSKSCFKLPYNFVYPSLRKNIPACSMTSDMAILDPPCVEDIIII